jgi:hypothetical protein
MVLTPYPGTPSLLSVIIEGIEVQTENPNCAQKYDGFDNTKTIHGRFHFGMVSKDGRYYPGRRNKISNTFKPIFTITSRIATRLTCIPRRDETGRKEY